MHHQRAHSNSIEMTWTNIERYGYNFFDLRATSAIMHKRTLANNNIKPLLMNHDGRWSSSINARKNKHTHTHLLDVGGAAGRRRNCWWRRLFRWTRCAQNAQSCLRVLSLTLLQWFHRLFGLLDHHRTGSFMFRPTQNLHNWLAGPPIVSAVVLVLNQLVDLRHNATAARPVRRRAICTAGAGTGRGLGQNGRLLEQR